MNYKSLPLILFCSVQMLAASHAADKSDSIPALFQRQLMLFPQEKIYVQTDKQQYMAGETLWLRAYLVDALSHRPDTTSRYVYAELVQKPDSVVRRIKIRPVRGAYHGHIDLPRNIANGRYFLRCYTRYMEALGDAKFFLRPITVWTPASASDSARQSYHPGTQAANFNAPISAAKSPDYDLQFFPEGGNFPANVSCRIAFKAINEQGLGEYVSGVVLGDAGDTVANFKAQHRGMGSFSMIAAEGRTYTAVCTNSSGTEKRFVLPQANADAVSLQARWQRNRLYVGVLHESNQPLPDSLYIIVQCRGVVGYAALLNPAKPSLLLPRTNMPSGVSQIILADKNLVPISERMVFCFNDALAPKISCALDRPVHARRERISAKLTFANIDTAPLLGSFSVSVVADDDASRDSSINILTSLLLTSELTGFVEHPAEYFRTQNARTVDNLDVLMLTQGWSRYSVKKILAGTPETPHGSLELGPTLAGTVRGGLTMTRPAVGYPVTLLALRYSVLAQLTDSKGRYYFSLPEMPDSTTIIVQVKTPKGRDHAELLIDPEIYPHVKTLQPLPPLDLKAAYDPDYVQRMSRKFAAENNMKLVELGGITVVAQKKPAHNKSPYSSPFNTSMDADEIEKFRIRDVVSALRRMAGVFVTGDNVTVQGSSGAPLFLVDNIEYDFDDVKNIDIDAVDDIEVVKSANAALFGSRGGNGVILISIKSGFDQRAFNPKTRFNIKQVMPLGYQVAREFYAPKYATIGQRMDALPDMRTTIYWNPDIRTDSLGHVNIDFYAADAKPRYTLVLEGVASDGTPISIEEKIH